MGGKSLEDQWKGILPKPNDSLIAWVHYALRKHRPVSRLGFPIFGILFEAPSQFLPGTSSGRIPEHVRFRDRLRRLKHVRTECRPLVLGNERHQAEGSRSEPLITTPCPRADAVASRDRSGGIATRVRSLHLHPARRLSSGMDSSSRLRAAGTGPPPSAEAPARGSSAPRSCSPAGPSPASPRGTDTCVSGRSRGRETVLNGATASNGMYFVNTSGAELGRFEAERALPTGPPSVRNLTARGFAAARPPARRPAPGHVSPPPKSTTKRGPSNVLQQRQFGRLVVKVTTIVFEQLG